EIDADETVKRVDQRNRVCAAGFGRARHVSNVSDIRCQLYDYRRTRDLLDPAGDHRRIFRHLPHGGAHAALGHAVRASEVQFQHVGAGVLGAAHDVMPHLALGFDHEGRDHGVSGKPLLDLGDLAQVGLDGTVADEFDVVEAHHALVLQVN